MDQVVKKGAGPMPRPRQFDEAAALATVRDEFARKGYEATSLDDIMRVTGLGKGSIYGAFGGKRQLFLSALQLYCDASLQAMHDALSSDKPAIDKLRGLFGVPDSGKSSTTPYRGCFLANSTTELAAHDHDVRGMARLTYKSVEAMLFNVVAQAKDSGDLANAVEPASFSRMLLTMMQGMEFLRKSGMATEEIRGVARIAETFLLFKPTATEQSHRTTNKRVNQSAVEAARSKKK